MPPGIKELREVKHYINDINDNDGLGMMFYNNSTSAAYSDLQYMNLWNTYNCLILIIKLTVCIFLNNQKETVRQFI